MEESSHIFLNVILGASLAIFIASFAYLFAQKFKTIPFPVLLVLIGILISPFKFDALDAIRITPDMVLFIFLPILLFESSFNFEYREFRRVMTPAFVFASVGLLISMTIVGGALSFITGMHITDGLLYGAIISSTDPIAVLTVFKKLGIPKRLQLLIDGESMLNDATSVILYRILLGLTATGVAGASGATFSGADLAGNLGEFFFVLLGGVIVGVIFALIIANLIAVVNNVSAVEIALTVILSHLVFIVSEHFLGVSGILAVLSAGMVMGNYGRTKISPEVLRNMEQIWEFLGFIATSFVFLLIGYEVNIAGLFDNWLIIVIMFIMVLVGRFASTYGVGLVYNTFMTQEKKKISLKWLHIANWGGLRGILPLVIILSLPETYEHRELFINLVLGAVYFSLVINGVSMDWLIKILNVDKPNTANLIEIKVTEMLVLRSLLRNIEDLYKLEEISKNTYTHHKEDIQIRLDKVEKKIENWASRGNSTTTEYTSEMNKVIRRYCLQIEKSVYSELFHKGVISETVYNNLRFCIESQTDNINEELDQFSIEADSLHKQIFKKNTGFRNLSNNVKKLWGYGMNQAVSDSFMYHKARLLGNEKVLEEMENFEDKDLQFFQEFELDTIRKTYTQLLNKNRNIIKSIETKYKKISHDIEEKLYHCESHALMTQIVKKLGEEDRISSKALTSIELKI